jgi:hypothetical protein
VANRCAGFDGSQLLATRIDTLLADPGFMAAIAQTNGPQAFLESAELTPLFTAPTRRRVPTSPAGLLRADVEAVRWSRQRDEELGVLVGWCLSGNPFDARLIIGGGGLGKTRLARKLSEEIRDGSVALADRRA